MSKIKLKRPKDHGYAVVWTESLPFLENRLATLMHRPKIIVTYNTLDHAHLAIHNWCGNAFTGTDKFTFHDKPPPGSVVCERCERFAVDAGEKTSDELAGIHVHKGRVKPKITCCDVDG